MALNIDTIVGKTVKIISYKNEYKKYSQISIEFTDDTSISISSDSIYHELIINLFNKQ